MIKIGNCNSFFGLNTSSVIEINDVFYNIKINIP